MNTESHHTQPNRPLAAALAALLAAAVAVPPAVAGSPPWAPAHGWRATTDGTPEVPRPQLATRGPVFQTPQVLGGGRCLRERVAQVLGGIAGAAAGSQAARGKGQLISASGGTLVGVLIGGAIGRAMSEADVYCLGQTLESMGDGERIAWNNPAAGTDYWVEPRRTVALDGGTYCREFVTTALIGETTRQAYGSACRQPDGVWRIVQ